MSAAPEDLSYIHRRCVLVDKLVLLEWAHPPYDTEGRYDLPLISVRMHRLRVCLFLRSALCLADPILGPGRGSVC